MPHPFTAHLTALALAALAAHAPLVAQAGGPGSGPRPRPEKRWSGKCVAVHDGDTFTVLHAETPVRVRLKGVDCPETDQRYGPAATRFTTRRALGKQLEVEVVGEHFDRKVARVSIKGKSLGEGLLKAGLAWHARKYDRSPALSAIQQEARDARRGLWKADHPEAPWTHRHRHAKGCALARAAEALAK